MDLLAFGASPMRARMPGTRKCGKYQSGSESTTHLTLTHAGVEWRGAAPTFCAGGWAMHNPQPKLALERTPVTASYASAAQHAIHQQCVQSTLSTLTIQGSHGCHVQ
jgi:hypothetical protein